MPIFFVAISAQTDFEGCAHILLVFPLLRPSCLLPSPASFRIRVFPMPSSSTALDCPICLSSLPPAPRCITLSCTHIFCIACLRRHVHTLLVSNVYPFPCPSCLRSIPKAEFLPLIFQSTPGISTGRTVPLIQDNISRSRRTVPLLQSFIDITGRTAPLLQDNTSTSSRTVPLIQGLMNMPGHIAPLIQNGISTPRLTALEEPPIQDHHISFLLSKLYITSLRYCANPKCATPFDYLSSNASSDCQSPSIVHCPMCKKKTCLSCQSICTLPHNCTTSTGPTHALREMSSRQNWKPCPNCGHLIDKVSGCRWVRCRCGQKFCFACGQLVCTCPWERRRSTNYRIRTVRRALRMLQRRQRGEVVDPSSSVSVMPEAGQRMLAHKCPNSSCPRTFQEDLALILHVSENPTCYRSLVGATFRLGTLDRGARRVMQDFRLTEMNARRIANIRQSLSAAVATVEELRNRTHTGRQEANANSGESRTNVTSNTVDTVRMPLTRLTPTGNWRLGNPIGPHWNSYPTALRCWRVVFGGAASDRGRFYVGPLMRARLENYVCPVEGCERSFRTRHLLEFHLASSPFGCLQEFESEVRRQRAQHEREQREGQSSERNVASDLSDR